MSGPEFSDLIATLRATVEDYDLDLDPDVGEFRMRSPYSGLKGFRRALSRRNVDGVDLGERLASDDQDARAIRKALHKRNRDHQKKAE
jgi:hypothetical protein